MRTVEATTDIDAPAEVVWDVLTDGAGYRRWNPFVQWMDGEFREGERVTLHVDPPGGRETTVHPRVTVVSPPHRLEWVGRLGLPNVIDGHHSCTLHRNGSGGVRFVQCETFSGVLVPFVFQETPFRSGFESMNEALRERAEAVAAERDAAGNGA